MKLSKKGISICQISICQISILWHQLFDGEDTDSIKCYDEF